MGQFLALKRAVISDDNSIVQKALSTSDPVEVKSILNSLRKDHIQEWEDGCDKIAEQELQANFT